MTFNAKQLARPARLESLATVTVKVGWRPVALVAMLTMLMSLTLAVTSCGNASSTEQAGVAPPPVFTDPAGEQLAQPEPVAFDPHSAGREVVIRVDAEQTTGARVWTGATDGPYAGVHAGILFVSGVDGGYIEPSDNIYTRMADQFATQGVQSVFVKYREPGVMKQSVQDAQAGAGWLRRQGVTRMAIVGWSFGGAVIMTSAPKIKESVTVIGFSPQSLYSEPVALFRKQSLLLFHSRADENVPYEGGAPVILSEAPDTIKKELVTLEGMNHVLDGGGAQIDPKVTSWLRSELLQIP